MLHIDYDRTTTLHPTFLELQCVKFAAQGVLHISVIRKIRITEIQLQYVSQVVIVSYS